MDNSKYKLIKSAKLDSAPDVYYPEKHPEIVHDDSPALDVFTDFKSKHAEMISPNSLTKEALEKMKANKTKSLLVESNNKIIGIVTNKHIQGVKAGETAQAMSIKMTELTVDMVMVKWENLVYINYKDLSNARVGHIKELMHYKNVNYCLVVEHCPNEKPWIRGIFSAARISRQLGEEVSGDLHTTNISDLSKRD